MKVAAGKDVKIQNETEKHESLVEKHSSDSGFFSSTTRDSRDYSLVNEVKGSNISGNKVNIEAGNDLAVRGSNVVATEDVNILAKGNINVTSAQRTGAEDHYYHETTSGIFSGGGIGFTIGSKSEKTNLQEKTLNEIGSTIGSVNGSVNMQAGNKVDSVGTSFVSRKDLNIIGKDVNIDNSVNTYDSQYQYEFKQSGLSVSLSGGAVDKATNAASDLRRSSNVQDDRLKALYDYKAYQDLKDVKKDIAIKPSIGVSIGSSNVKTEENTHTETVNMSNISAGGKVNITATEKDITLKGTQIDAADVNLAAKGNVNIEAAQNKQQTDSKTSSSSWSVGGNIGIGYFGNVSSGKGNENGTVITNEGSVINASGTATIISGQDTNIIGSQVKGDKVTANVGGNLNIASLQDTDNYNAKNQSSGFGITSGPTSGVTGSIGKGKTDSDYASVTQQAGIAAGKDGFDIKVGQNTDLKGVVIASDAAPDKNKLSTDTLTYSDINNKAEYSASSVGVNYDSKKYSPTDKDYKNQGLTPNIGVTASGDADSTTKSTIVNGTIDIRSNPKQDISNLSRDTSSSLTALGKIFDKKKIEEQQELAKVFGEEAFKAVGDLAAKNGWKEGSSEKTALHALVGGMMSSLGGNTFASGAVGAGVNETIQKQLANIKDPALHQWASAVVGAAAAKIVGGNAVSGASTAASGTRNNFLTHYQIQSLTTDLKNALARHVSREQLQGIIAKYIDMTNPEAAGIFLSDFMDGEGAEFKTFLKENFMYDWDAAKADGLTDRQSWDSLWLHVSVQYDNILGKYIQNGERRVIPIPSETPDTVLKNGGWWNSDGRLVDRYGQARDDMPSRGDYAYSQGWVQPRGYYENGVAIVTIEGNDYPAYNAPRATVESVLKVGGTWNSSGQLTLNGTVISNLPGRGDYEYSKDWIVEGYYSDGTAARFIDGVSYPIYSAPKKQNDDENTTKASEQNNDKTNIIIENPVATTGGEFSLRGQYFKIQPIHLVYQMGQMKLEM